MIRETGPAGLLYVSRTVNNIVLGRSDNSYVELNAAAPLHDSMSAGWKLLEYIPRRVPENSWRKRGNRGGIYLPLEDRRFIPDRANLHGVDLTLFHPPEGADDTIAASGLPGRYLVGCFGRVRHQKGTDLFVQAMIALLPQHPDWTAVISGRVTPEHTAFADKLKADIAAAGLTDRIVFIGEVPDIKVWYRRLSLYVAPSRNEGFGLTPLEAMASKTPVVASDAGAYAEMVVPGENGVIVPPGDGDALTAAIATYLADPALTSAQGETALRHVRENFALEKEATAINRIYQQLLGA